jgi:ATP-dependent RNA helicase DeaD
VLLSGKDLIGQAGTGTGKTAAFALPMLHRLLEARPAAGHGPRGLILVPTRELAMQVARSRPQVLEANRAPRGARLRRRPHGPAGPLHSPRRGRHRRDARRALDLMRRKALVLDTIEVLILDEADEMLDMGFAEDLETILTATPRRGRPRCLRQRWRQGLQRLRASI